VIGDDYIMPADWLSNVTLNEEKISSIANEIELIVEVWVIPMPKMKIRTRYNDHRIPLCPEIVTELRYWKGIVGSHGSVFPSPATDKTITREGVEKAYRVTLNLRGKHVPHGWRSAFSTLARDQGFAREVVELALDHTHDNEVARAYDRGERFTQRVELFNWWGEQLAAAQHGEK